MDTGNVLVLEGCDSLQHAILKDFEVIFLHVRHQPAIFIQHGHIQDNLIHVALQGEAAMGTLFQLGPRVAEPGCSGLTAHCPRHRER